MAGTQTAIILPSFNESENILTLVDDLLACGPGYSVCVVDDSSPDGTGALVRQAIASRAGWTSRVHLMERSGKQGRGSAVRAGFEWAVKNPNFSAFVEMDCDYSHEPKAVPQGVGLLAAGADVVLGVRYPDGTIIGWPWTRRLFSFFANHLAQAMINRRIPDYTNGFRFYNRKAVSVLVSQPQHHRGYIYLSESLCYLLEAGMTIQWFPIVFRNRVRGKSNTTLTEIVHALTGLFSIAWQYRFGKK
jgi:dolichol-phosphate mannosyltransferase